MIIIKKFGAKPLYLHLKAHRDWFKKAPAEKGDLGSKTTSDTLLSLLLPGERRDN